MIPNTYEDKKILQFNGMIPIYCLKIVLYTRDLDLVFQTFREIRELFLGFLLPLKYTTWEKSRIRLAIPSLGKVYWLKLKFLISWRLGQMNVIQISNQKKSFSFCKLVIMAKTYLLKDDKA